MSLRLPNRQRFLGTKVDVMCMVDYYIEDRDIENIDYFVKKFAQPELITLFTIWPVTFGADHAVYVNPERAPNATVSGDCGLAKFSSPDKQSQFIERLTAALGAASVAYIVDHNRGRMVVEAWNKMKEIRLQQKSK